MRAFAVHFGSEFRAGLRNPSQLLMNYLFPLGFYALMGAVMTQLNPAFRETLVPAMAVFAVMVATLLGLPGPLVEARASGIYRSYRIIGVPAASVLAMPALTTVFHGLIAAGIVAASAPRFFRAASPADVLAFAGVMVVAAFAFAGGALLIGVVAKSSRATTLLSQAVFLPSMMLGGLMVPMSALPSSVRPFAALLPSTYIMQAMNGFAFHRATVIDPAVSLLVLVSAGALAVVLAALLFEWDGKGGSRRAHPAFALLSLAPYVIAAALL
jgi:ABC-2 type transport system permease protein